ncbi:MAG: glycerophosphodiester phosphodiesterase [Clostridiales bacterium]|jgi:glycerophosphoryl diester phosphodiesterase|nr:glycerophosphodiester phosphodiesterase [Clostridiales bacterium]
MDIKNSWLVKKPIAHRGLHNDAQPENSLGAFENAIKHGYPIELDVHALDDGTVVVFHDESLCRMTGRDGYITNLKADDLKDIRLAKTDAKIPTFAETLEFVAGRTPILIEIKNDGKIGTLEKSLHDLVKHYDGEFAVQSFNPYSVEYFKKNAPHIPRGQLSCFFKGSDLTRLKRYMLKRLKFFSTARPDFISYQFGDLPNRWVSRRSVPVLAWTIRSSADLESVQEYCDNIIFEGILP